MKKLLVSILALAGALYGCQQAELADPNDVGGQTMKTVTISTEVTGIETKAALDSETGEFSWQNGDVISVLATDGKFYDFSLTEGAGDFTAEFKGQIPVESQITTVATYPTLVGNGTENTLLEGTTLNYVLPSEWTWKKEVTNVPMVAAFAEGAERMSFKQIGGVMRFPVKNMPYKGSFVLSMVNTKITGSFPLDITKLGEEAIVAGSVAQAAPANESDGFKDVVIEVAPDVEIETLTIHYDADVDGDLVEFNVPVPTGVYTDFDVEIKDNNGEVLFKKHYVRDNVVERSVLLNMSPIELPLRNMAAPTVWPYFVDARAVLPVVEEGVTQYAVFVDGAAEPVIKDVEMVDNKATLSFGGDFAHNSTHTVAVAKVHDGVVLTTTKSAEVEFTTAGVRQLTTNTGTKFVSVGWDDVALEGGPKFVDGKWTAVKAANYPDLDDFGRKLHQKRGYQVQLFADDMTTLLYDMIPFDGHSIHQNAFYDSNTIGKIEGSNLVTPTALSFSHLEPGKDYYFRVKTLDGVVYMDFEKGNYNPEDEGEKEYPYPLSSERGGSAWSEFVKLSTDPAHVPSANEVFHEGFDDIMIASDYVNWAVGVVPDLDATKRQSWADYLAGAKTAYSAFLQTAADQRKWTVHGFNQRPTVDQYGMIDGGYVKDADNILNANAGSMQGWTLKTSKIERNIFPMFGAIAIGQLINNHGGSSIATPPINSDKLNDETTTKCIVTMKVSYISANKVPPGSKSIYLGRYKDGASVGEPTKVDVSEQCPDEWNSYYVQHHTDANNYINYQHLYEIQHEMLLKNGECIWIEKKTESDPYKEYGWYIIGDIKVEVVSDVVVPTFKDDGVGTEPDGTDYDVYGLGEFPVSHWYTVEPWAYTNPDGTYNDELTKQRYQEMKDAGINTTIYYGHELNYSIAEQKRILGICEEIGLNFMGMCPEEGNIDNIPEIKSQLAPSKYYLGHCISDEPSATKFDKLGQYTKAFLQEIPEKDVFVNLFPMYANVNRLGTSTYAQHIDQYLEKVPTKALSFDYYPFFKAGIGDNFFTNMDLVRSKTLAKRMPYWMITQAGVVNENLLPTEKQERWSVWAAIALGSKGISYFCYWTPSGDQFKDTPYMIDHEGNKTDFYYIIQRLNADIKTIGKKLLPCHPDGAIMTATKYYPLFDNDGTGRTNYGPVKEVTGSHSILCGCFRDARVSENGENYKGYKTLVMSQMPDRTVDAYLTLDPSVSEITITHNNTTQTVQVSNTLSTVVGGVVVSFDGAKLTLGIPEGEAALLEF